MKPKALRTYKAPMLHTNGLPYKQNTHIRQAKKYMSRAQFFRGGGRSQSNFYYTVLKPVE